MQKKLKSNLFRFVTLRAPQLLSNERRAIGFAENPHPSDSVFLKAVSRLTLDNARDRLVQEAKKYNGLKTANAVKKLSPAVWEYSMWLSKNKNELTVDSVTSNGFPRLPAKAIQVKIWDNLFYDIITRKNPNIRQACLQLIVAINFVEGQKKIIPSKAAAKAKIGEEKLTTALRHLANGKVVIPVFFTAKKSDNKAETNIPVSSSYAKQEIQHKAFVAAQDIEPLSEIRKEIVNLNTRYQIDYNTKFTRDNKAYATAVNKKIKTYLNQEGKARQKAAGGKSPISPMAPFSGDVENPLEYNIPEDLIEDFEFSFEKPLSKQYTKGKLSVKAAEFIEKNQLERENVKIALEKIDRKINNTKKVAAQSKRRTQKDLLVNGVLVRPNSSGTNNFTLSFKKEAPIGKRKNVKSLYFSINTGFRGAFFRNASYKITIGTKIYSGKDLRVLANDSNTLFGQLFSDKPFDAIDNNVFKFAASIELNNGKEILIEKDGLISQMLSSGSAVPAPPKSNSGDVVLHGINKIGVADYRRVEQELCCYVAGEVSHIENILAREYKEKFTRNLTSTESTFESTDEREVEDLNDTTTTSRHEMSTEIAEVINKDRNSNLGFNASVSGEYPQISFSTGAYGDFASGQSTSDSNSTARTYAEDVTERALERIVQKTTVKRTSKILKEFEENNKHGFDNREGEQHVTGVYRWLDKVYKNRLVNYGKRLVYEFMVPEPSRFYKQAIIIKAEEEDTNPGSDGGSDSDTSVAIKPDHPSEHGLNDASDLTRSNYSSIASIYGVSVDVPRAAESNLSHTYTQSIGNTDKPKSFSYPDNLRVAQDYECIEIKGTANYNYKARVGAKAYIKVNTASKNWERVDLRGTGNNVQEFTHTITNIEGAISVSVNTKKMTSFNLVVEAKCQLKASVFEQWQQDTYDTIMRAYEQQLQAFNDAQALADIANATDDAVAEDSTVSRNPRFNTSIIKTELKRLCIEMLTRPFNIRQGADFYENGRCDIPQLKLNRRLDHYASHVKFFEQAFDWELMSYLFYPYYWAKKCDWTSLFQSQDGKDHIFQSFLQSGMGRVMAPVREGFEEAVIYFMETGEIWNGTGIVIDTDDELYLSIVDELAVIDGKVEEEWETVVPSSLTIVQARSVLLDEEGLPCCETDAEVLKELNLQPDTNILELMKG